MPSMIKLAKRRVIVAKLILNLLRSISQNYLEMENFGANAGNILLMFAIFIGQAEGRPMTASKLSKYTGIPRPTVLRKLSELRANGMAIINKDRTAGLETWLANNPIGLFNHTLVVRHIIRAAEELSKMDTKALAALICSHQFSIAVTTPATFFV